MPDNIIKLDDLLKVYIDVPDYWPSFGSRFGANEATNMLIEIESKPKPHRVIRLHDGRYFIGMNYRAWFIDDIVSKILDTNACTVLSEAQFEDRRIVWESREATYANTYTVGYSLLTDEMEIGQRFETKKGYIRVRKDVADVAPWGDKNVLTELKRHLEITGLVMKRVTNENDSINTIRRITQDERTELVAIVYRG